MKILAADFDNTIFFLDDEQTTNKNIEAIKQFVARENIFCIITGRTYMEIKKDLKKINLPYTYLVCGDGAMIFDSKNQCINKLNLDKKIVERALEILRKNGYEPYLEDGYIITNNLDDCIKISSVYAKDKADGIRVAKLISDELDVYAYASREHVNVNNSLNDKKQAILRLAEIAGFPKENIHTIGDEVNDYEMLESFNSATVKKHSPILDELKIPIYNTLADYIDYLLNT